MTELESHQKIRLGLLKLTGNNTAATAKVIKLTMSGLFYEEILWQHKV